MRMNDYIIINPLTDQIYQPRRPNNQASRMPWRGKLLEWPNAPCQQTPPMATFHKQPHVQVST
jgi:hypothetical protein